MQGRIIEYIEQGKFICAVVLSENGRRLHLLNQNGREVNLPAARIMYMNAVRLPAALGREEALGLLRETAKRRNEMSLPVALEEIWQLVVEEERLDFSLEFIADLCFGREVSDDQAAALLRAVLQDKLYFKYKDGRLYAHSLEAVEQLREQEARARQKEEFLNSSAAALERLMAGEEVEISPDCLRTLSEYYLFDKDAADFTLARELIKRAGLTAPHAVFHLLVKAGYWTADENIPLLRYQLPVEFSSEAMAQAAEIAVSPVPAAGLEGRVDLRDLPLITVDGPSTRDFDDALHVRRLEDGSFEAGIHIADVAAFVKPGTALFAAACERTTSLYFPDGMVPMLPPVLSEGAFSLLAAEERPALSFMVTLAADGRVLNKKIVRSMVRVRRQLSYQEAEDLLAVDQELGDLVMLSRRLRDNRVEAGAMLIPVPDVVLKLVDNEVKEVCLEDVDSTMRLMVAEFMVLANSLAAGFLANRQEPGLYRSQGPPRKRFFKFPPQDDLFTLFRQRRFLSRGNLGTVPKRHEGVGVEQYTTTTSPIRRLLDLIIQLQISAILAGKGALFTENDLKGYAGIMAGVQSRLNLVRQQRQRYWLLKYLESRKGERMAAFVLDRLHGKIQVVIQKFLLQTELPANQGVKHELGDVVMVKLAAVNALNGTCRFEW